MRFSGLLLLALALVVTSACREPKKVLTEREKQQVQESVITDVPAGENIYPVNAVFDDKLVLLAYALPKPTVKPGEALTMTLYWKALTQIDGEYKIFIHFDSTKNQRKTFDHHAINNLYPVANWKPGEVVKDEVLIQVDSGFPQAPARVWIGLFDEKAWREQKKNVRMEVKSAGSARADKENRLLLTTVLVGDAQLKNVQVKKAATPPTVDGDLSDAGWTEAFAAAGIMVTPEGKPLPEASKAEVGLQYDDNNLYIAFKVKDSDVQCTYTDTAKRDQTLWSGGEKKASDVVEMFLDPDGDGQNYLELQVAPTGAVFDAKFDSLRNPKWEAAATFTIDMKQAVQVQGTLNGPGGDQGYTVEVAVPWTGIPGLTGAPMGKPFKANFYRLSGSGPFAGTLAPVGNDFHDLSLGATLTLVP